MLLCFFRGIFEKEEKAHSMLFTHFIQIVFNWTLQSWVLLVCGNLMEKDHLHSETFSYVEQIWEDNTYESTPHYSILYCAEYRLPHRFPL